MPVSCVKMQMVCLCIFYTFREMALHNTWNHANSYSSLFNAINNKW